MLIGSTEKSTRKSEEKSKEKIFKNERIRECILVDHISKESRRKGVFAPPAQGGRGGRSAFGRICNPPAVSISICNARWQHNLRENLMKNLKKESFIKRKKDFPPDFFMIFIMISARSASTCSSAPPRNLRENLKKRMREFNFPKLQLSSY